LKSFCQTEISDFLIEADLTKDEDFQILKRVIGAKLLYKRILTGDARRRISSLVSRSSNTIPNNFADPINSNNLEFSSPTLNDGRDVLQFSSDFEGGNLKFSSVNTSGEYFLSLAKDLGIPGLALPD
jgi:hypothetical protein